MGVCDAGSCSIVQNEAGTRDAEWHKSDTGGSPSVPADPSAQNETAVPAGPRNGDGSIVEKSADAASGYHTGADAATRAGLWYAENRAVVTRPIIPALRSRFGLSALEAVQAIRIANGVPR